MRAQVESRAAPAAPSNRTDLPEVNESNTSFATALGGGMDYKIFHAVAWRLEGDYVHTRFFSAGQNNVRISTGIMLRF